MKFVYTVPLIFMLSSAVFANDYPAGDSTDQAKSEIQFVPTGAKPGQTDCPFCSNNFVSSAPLIGKTTPTAAADPNAPDAGRIEY